MATAADDRPMTRQRFAELLRAQINGRTQTEIAALTGIDQALISRYLRATHRPSSRSARRLAVAFPDLADALRLLLFWDGTDDEGPEEAA